MKPPLSTNIGWFGILAVVALCLLSRLPQLTSPYLHTDTNGDECVLGLMAEHMASGKEFPFYFWGQDYGFSWVEAGAVALAIKLFGASIFSLKVPMLLLWTLGCVFFYCALAEWTTKIYGFWITCLMILSPAWMGWSMRARAGYITSFLLSMIVLFLVARNRQSLSQKMCLCIGVLLGLIFFSQPTFLFGVLPLLVYAISKQGKFKGIFICITGFIGVFIFGKVMACIQGNTDFWKSGWFRYDNFLIFASTFKNRVFNVLSQDSGFAKNWAPAILSNAWCTFSLVGLGMYIWGLITKKAISLSTPFLISVVLMLGCTFFTNCEDQYRYLLALSIFLILWFGIQSFEWVNKNLFLKAFQVFVVGVFIVLGIFTAWDYKDFYRLVPGSSNGVPEMQNISKVIGFLKASNVKYVFSLDEGLSWKILFFSREKITSRWAYIRSRYPEYNNAVTQAFLSGQKVALVGNFSHQNSAYSIVTNEGTPEFLADDYFVYLHPSPVLIIDKLGFEFFESPAATRPNK